MTAPTRTVAGARADAATAHRVVAAPSATGVAAAAIVVGVLAQAALASGFLVGGPGARICMNTSGSSRPPPSCSLPGSRPLHQARTALRGRDARRVLLKLAACGPGHSAGRS